MEKEEEQQIYTLEKINDKSILQAMFMEATIGIVVVNDRGLILFTNRLARQQFGYSGEELMQQPVDTLVPKGKKNSHKHYRDKYHAQPEPRLMGAGRELEGKRKDGSTFPIEISLSPVKVEGNNLVIAFVHDISERRKAERSMAREQKLARTYLDMAGSLIIVLDRDEKISLANNEAADILGYTVNELIGKNWFDNFIAKEERENVRGVFDQIFLKKTAHVEYFENRIITKSKGQRLIRWYNRRIENKAGEITGIISSGVDITEQQKAKAALENYAIDLEKAVANKTKALSISSAKLEQASNLSKVGYWEISFKGEQSTVIFSKEYCQLFGVNLEECEGDRNYFLQFIHEDYRNSVVEKTKQSIKKGGGKFQFEANKRSGEPIHLHAEMRCIYNEHDVLETVFSVVQDITEQKKAEIQLKNSLDRERELGQLKSRFVSMASHEFRTPLTSILSSVSLIEMLNQKGKYDSQKKYISRIESSVDNMISILNDFLSLEKLESGKVSIVKEDIHFIEFIDEIKDDIGLTAKKGQRFEHHHKGEETIQSDPHLMKNILINLLSNAIKYSPENALITMNSERRDGALKISIKDQGIGIPLEDQKHMFTRFFRANNATNIKGTGLGLTIVRRYLELMGGAISFDSEENVGTTFHVNIPQ